MSNNCSTYIKVRRRNCRLEIYKLSTEDDSFCGQILDVSLSSSLQILRQVDNQVLFLFPFNTSYMLTYNANIIVCDVADDGTETELILSFEEFVEQVIYWRAECDQSTEIEEENNPFELQPICYANGTDIAKGWVYGFINEGDTSPTFEYYDAGFNSIPTPTVVPCPEEPQFEIQDVGCYIDSGIYYTKILVIDEENLTNANPTVLFLGSDGTVSTSLSATAIPCQDDCGPATSGFEINGADLASGPQTISSGFLSNTFTVLNLTPCPLRITYTGTGVLGNKTHYILGGADFCLPSLKCPLIEDITIEPINTCDCADTFDPAVLIDVIRIN